jgi:hypothetical protein
MPLKWGDIELKVKDKMKPKFFIKTVLNKSFHAENDLIFPVIKNFNGVRGIVKNFFLVTGPDKPEPKRLATEDTEYTDVKEFFPCDLCDLCG